MLVGVQHALILQGQHDFLTLDEMVGVVCDREAFQIAGRVRVLCIHLVEHQRALLGQKLCSAPRLADPICCAERGRVVRFARVRVGEPRSLADAVVGTQFALAARARELFLNLGKTLLGLIMLPRIRPVSDRDLFGGRLRAARTDVEWPQAESRTELVRLLNRARNFPVDLRYRSRGVQRRVVDLVHRSAAARHREHPRPLSPPHLPPHRAADSASTVSLC